MSIDLSHLSAGELDELMAEAARRRADMLPEHPKEPPQTVNAVVDPAWYTVLVPESQGTIVLNIRHPGYGWLAFAIPPHEIANLMKFWSAMLAAAVAGKDQAPGVKGSVH